MFSEYRERVTQLKSEDAQFSKLFRRHQVLSVHIQNMEANIRPVATTVLEGFKREKRMLEDKLRTILRA
ncbi:hypothetical protein LMG18101_02954 [Ralstonia flaminis]|jgi:uncharacterized protein YdcH (DUF465 family)|uniref:DUF465 domain-containing protein n=2 Tax=Ralstonia flaminis TaxID=3058597 RepID=A0ABM9K5S7_9RALS|nr:hypothetical protein LMG18101_02954 [Ralstonia sp. LMG 18101]